MEKEKICGVKAADIIKSDVGMYYFPIFSVTCSFFVCQQQYIVCSFVGTQGRGRAIREVKDRAEWGEKRWHAHSFL